MRSIFVGKIIAALRLCIVSLMVMHSVELAADTRTWKSDTTGYWSNPANWEEGVVPVAGDALYYSFSFVDVPDLEFSPSSGSLAPLQTNTIFMTCLAGSSHTGVYNGVMSVLATNLAMSDMAPYAVDIAAEIEVVPPPAGTILMLR